MRFKDALLPIAFVLALYLSVFISFDRFHNAPITDEMYWCDQGNEGYILYFRKDLKDMESRKCLKDGGKVIKPKYGDLGWRG